MTMEEEYSAEVNKNRAVVVVVRGLTADQRLLLLDQLIRKRLLSLILIRYLLIGRVLRFIRLLVHIERFHAFVTTFLTLIHCLLPYLGIIFYILCIYCSLGLQIFGGIVNIGNPKLHQTDLAGYDYLLFNFNDYPNVMVTLFNLLVMGIWSPLMHSYKKLTGTSWTYVYFFSFYLIAVLWLLNLLYVILVSFRRRVILEPVVNKNCS